MVMTVQDRALGLPSAEDMKRAAQKKGIAFEKTTPRVLTDHLHTITTLNEELFFHEPIGAYSQKWSMGDSNDVVSSGIEGEEKISSPAEEEKDGLIVTGTQKMKIFSWDPYALPRLNVAKRWHEKIFSRIVELKNSVSEYNPYFIREWTRDHPRGKILVVREGLKILGFAMYHPQEEGTGYELYWIVVDEKHRSIGKVGPALMDQVIADLKDLNQRELHLTSNSRSFDFYKTYAAQKGYEFLNKGLEIRIIFSGGMSSGNENRKLTIDNGRIVAEDGSTSSPAGVPTDEKISSPARVAPIVFAYNMTLEDAERWSSDLKNDFWEVPQEMIHMTALLVRPVFGKLLKEKIGKQLSSDVDEKLEAITTDLIINSGLGEAEFLIHVVQGPQNEKKYIFEMIVDPLQKVLKDDVTNWKMIEANHALFDKMGPEGLLRESRKQGVHYINFGEGFDALGSLMKEKGKELGLVLRYENIGQAISPRLWVDLTPFLIASSSAGTPTGVITPPPSLGSDSQGSNKTGGIDFNRENLPLETNGRNIDFALIPELEGIDLNSIQGFVPVIINITPVQNISQLLGLKEEDVQKLRQAQTPDPAREPEKLSLAH